MNYLLLYTSFLFAVVLKVEINFFNIVDILLAFFVFFYFIDMVDVLIMNSEIFLFILQ